MSTFANYRITVEDPTVKSSPRRGFQFEEVCNEPLQNRIALNHV